MASKYSAGGNVEANSIAGRIDYIQTLADELVATSVKTSSMTADPRLVQALQNAGEVKVRTLDFSGAPLETMGASGQYPLGSAKTTWQTITLANDEGKAFDISYIEQVKGGIVGQIAYDISEYTRQQVVPRVDKVRLAKLATTGYVKDKRGATGAAPTKANIYSTVMAGLKAIANDFGSEEGNTIYMPYSYAAMLDASTEIAVTKDVKNSAKSIVARVNDIDGNPIVRIPDAYMTTHAFAINAPGTVMGIADIRIKHVPSEINTRGDGDFVGFHVYHDAVIMENKAAGTYSFLLTTTTG